MRRATLHLFTGSATLSFLTVSQKGDMSESDQAYAGPELEREPILCSICAERPREMRLQCGHLFACEICVRRLKACALCREPITAMYAVLGRSRNRTAYPGPDGSSDSSELCFARDCREEAQVYYECPDCAVKNTSGNRFGYPLCRRCRNQWKKSKQERSRERR